MAIETEMTFDEAREVLREFLGAAERSDDCLNIDQFLGAMVAVLVCPEDAGLGDIVLGDDPEGERLWFGDADIRTAWIVCASELRESLAAERFSLENYYPLAMMAEAPTQAFSDWCDGYLRGSVLTEQAWAEAHEFLVSEDIEGMAQEHETFLSLLACFADWPQALADNDHPDKLVKDIPMLFKACSPAIATAYGIASVLRANRERTDSAPFVREGERTGRNDPCPCGSGKKFKKCCLH